MKFQHRPWQRSSITTIGNIWIFMQRLHIESMLPGSPAYHRILSFRCPVHKSRMKKRGFNQAEEFGKRLSHYLEIPMNSSLLIRSKKTVPQKDLGPALRLKNLEQAFSCRKLPYRMKKVLLIDDIYTTGSTAEACSRALKKAGAEQVFLLVIATSSNR